MYQNTRRCKPLRVIKGPPGPTGRNGEYAAQGPVQVLQVLQD